METTAQRNLPMNIVETILTKLPAKSLLRFQAVSKTYMATIRKPSFCRTHLEQARRNHRSNSFLVRRWRGGSSFLARFVDQKLRLEKEVDRETLELLLRNDFEPICFCDDMVFFSQTKDYRSDEEDEDILWNPINNTRRKIYNPLSYRKIYNLGLCHDQAEDDYKLVLVFEEKAYTVYSFKYGTWAALKKYDRLRFCPITKGIFVDGKLYWFGFDASSFWAIIYFDPTCDGLKELEIPEGFRNGYRRPYLINLRGRLCFYGDLKGSELLQFWTMQEGNSWELTICIDKRCLYGFSSLWTTCNVGHRCHLIGDEIVIFLGGCDVYIIYHILENRVVGHGETPLTSIKAPFARDLVLSLASFFTPTLHDS